MRSHSAGRSAASEAQEAYFQPLAGEFSQNNLLDNGVKLRIRTAVCSPDTHPGSNVRISGKQHLIVPVDVYIQEVTVTISRRLRSMGGAPRCLGHIADSARRFMV